MVCFMLLLVFLCGIVLISYLYYNYCIIICKSATSHKFLRSKLYIFHKNRCKTDKPVRTSQKKIWHFFCVCSAITQHHTKKKQVFFSQKICSCSTIAYNFFLCLRGYSLLPVRFPFHKLTSHFYFLADPGIVLNKISQHGCCLHSGWSYNKNVPLSASVPRSYPELHPQSLRSEHPRECEARSPSNKSWLPPP